MPLSGAGMETLPGDRGNYRGRQAVHVGRHAFRCPSRLTNQLQQMVILHALNLIREYYKPPVNFIQFPAVELIAQLFAAQIQRVPPGMLSQHQARIV